MKAYSSVSRVWIYTDRFGVDMDSLNVVVKKVSVFHSNTDEVVWSDDGVLRGEFLELRVSTNGSH